MAEIKDRDLCEGHELLMFPVYELNREEFEKGNILFHRGSGCDFKKNSKLPLNSLHYKYPENMWIVELSNPMWVIDVKNGEIVNTGSTRIINCKIDKPVYDTYGHKLKIRDYTDLIQLCDDFLMYARNEITSDQFTSKWFEISEESFVKFGRYIEVFYKIFHSEKSFKDVLKKHFFKFISEKNINLNDFIYKYYDWVNDESILPKEDLDILKKELE